MKMDYENGLGNVLEHVRNSEKTEDGIEEESLKKPRLWRELG